MTKAVRFLAFSCLLAAGMLFGAANHASAQAGSVRFNLPAGVTGSSSFEVSSFSYGTGGIGASAPSASNTFALQTTMANGKAFSQLLQSGKAMPTLVVSAGKGTYTFQNVTVINASTANSAAGSVQYTLHYGSVKVQY